MFEHLVYVLHLSFPEITESETTTSTHTTDITDISGTTALAVGVTVGAAILITVAIVVTVVIATIYWIKRKQKKSFNSGKERKTYHTSTEKVVKETDF